MKVRKKYPERAQQDEEHGVEDEVERAQRQEFAEQRRHRAGREPGVRRGRGVEQNAMSSFFDRLANPTRLAMPPLNSEGC